MKLLENIAPCDNKADNYGGFIIGDIMDVQLFRLLLPYPTGICTRMLGEMRMIYAAISKFRLLYGHTYLIWLFAGTATLHIYILY